LKNKAIQRVRGTHGVTFVCPRLSPAYGFNDWEQQHREHYYDDPFRAHRHHRNASRGQNHF
jgi:hypothetical protein